MVARIDGDAIPDIVYTNLLTIAVVLGKGDGTFGAPIFYDAPMNTSAYRIVDVNADNKPDLVFATALGQTIEVVATETGRLASRNPSPPDRSRRWRWST